jgi:hypothetical protein
MGKKKSIGVGKRTTTVFLYVLPTQPSVPSPLDPSVLVFRLSLNRHPSTFSVALTYIKENIKRQRK